MLAVQGMLQLTAGNIPHRPIARGNVSTVCKEEESHPQTLEAVYSRMTCQEAGFPQLHDAVQAWTSQGNGRQGEGQAIQSIVVPLEFAQTFYARYGVECDWRTMGAGWLNL